jgi:hypothetical protein
MTREDLGERIARALDQGLDDLPTGTLYRLRLAREKALSQFRDGAAPERVFAPSLLSRRLLVPLFAVIVALSGLVMWQQHTMQNTGKTDLAELDAQVLSDELPVTAYLDQGFEVWLDHHNTE